jgi:hypothetical protein
VTIPPLSFDPEELRRNLSSFAEDVMAKVG